MDPYKCLLASASREHVRRSNALQSPLVGNVFLPAIQTKPTRAGGNGGSIHAASAKHLKVIEQCIQSENRREEQLAKCQTDKERRYWTRKFQAQRSHERDLVEALMIGHPDGAELEILDADAGSRPMSPLEVSVSSNHRGKDSIAASAARSASKPVVGGLTSSVHSPDRVFHKSAVTGGVPRAKPHVRKKFTLPDCQGSPVKKKPVANSRSDRRLPSESASPINSMKNANDSMSPERKRSSSRSASSGRSPSGASASSPATLKPRQQELAMEDRQTRNSPKTRVPPLAAMSSTSNPSSRAASRRQKEEPIDTSARVTTFDGAQSFAAARHIALQCVSVGEEKETQTTTREPLESECPEQWASTPEIRAQLPPVPSDSHHINPKGVENGHHSKPRPSSSPTLRSKDKDTRVSKVCTRPIEQLVEDEQVDADKSGPTPPEHRIEPLVADTQDCRDEGVAKPSDQQIEQLGDAQGNANEDADVPSDQLEGVDFGHEEEEEEETNVPVLIEIVGDAVATVANECSIEAEPSDEGQVAATSFTAPITIEAVDSVELEEVPDVGMSDGDNSENPISTNLPADDSGLDKSGIANTDDGQDGEPTPALLDDQVVAEPLQLRDISEEEKEADVDGPEELSPVAGASQVDDDEEDEANAPQVHDDEEYEADAPHVDDDEEYEADAPLNDNDDELETDVAEVLFDLVDLVEVAVMHLQFEPTPRTERDAVEDIPSFTPSTGLMQIATLVCLQPHHCPRDPVSNARAMFRLIRRDRSDR